MKLFLDIVLGITGILGPIVVFEWMWCWKMINRGDPPNAYESHKIAYGLGALVLVVVWGLFILSTIVHWIWQHA